MRRVPVTKLLDEVQVRPYFAICHCWHMTNASDKLLNDYNIHGNV